MQMPIRMCHDHDKCKSIFDCCIDFCTPILSGVKRVIIYPGSETCLLDSVDQDFGKITVLVTVRDKYMLHISLFPSVMCYSVMRNTSALGLVYLIEAYMAIC